MHVYIGIAIQPYLNEGGMKPRRAIVLAITNVHLYELHLHAFLHSACSPGSLSFSGEGNKEKRSKYMITRFLNRTYLKAIL